MNTTRQSIFRYLHFSSSSYSSATLSEICVTPLTQPYCHFPDCVSTPWLTLIDHYGWEATGGTLMSKLFAFCSIENSLKAAFTRPSTSQHLYQCGSQGASEGPTQPPCLCLQFSFPLCKLGKVICRHAVWWFSAHPRSAKDNGDVNILACFYWLVTH